MSSNLLDADWQAIEAQADLNRSVTTIRKAVINRSDECIWAVDSGNRYLLVNDAARRTAGHVPNVPGNAIDWAKITFQIHHPDGSPMTADEWPLMRALRGEWVYNVRMQVVSPWRPEGYHVHCREASPIYIDDQLVGAVCFFREVSA